VGWELVNPEGMHPAPGFSHVAIATGSTLVYIAGQVVLIEIECTASV